MPRTFMPSHYLGSGCASPMALWSDVGPAIYNDNNYLYRQNKSEKLHRCIWWTLVVFPHQRAEQGFSHHDAEGKLPLS